MIGCRRWRPINIARATFEEIDEVWAVTHQSAYLRCGTPPIDRWQTRCVRHINNIEVNTTSGIRGVPKYPYSTHSRDGIAQKLDHLGVRLWRGLQ